ncbi:SDR family NAD(P)-dependent oxidoreductase [Mycobacterium sp. WMMD1722]|uniref:SDR family NAD(P)-dependent oxidoreductase n=1 Tax=Mycobacterium sp. WMMD1722 TaxID=3404117 RepID=UPI003BF5D6A2
MRRTTDPLDRFRGGWALVSGSARAEGLGYAFARALAAAGINLVLTDVLDAALHDRAAELRSEFGVEVRAAVCDLGEPAPYPTVEAAVGDIAVDILVCNHMLTPADTPPILEMPLEVHSRLIDVNARGYTNLVHRFATDMRRRGRGAIVIVSSGAGLTSAPYTSAYAANKAFQIALGEGLWYELRGSGVDVLVMIGGLMDTQGDALKGYPQFLMAQPEDVVREVLSAIGRKHIIIPGRINRAFLLLQTRLMPRRATLIAMGRFMARGLGKGN